MKIAIVLAAVAATLYLIFHQNQQAVVNKAATTPIVFTPSTPGGTNAVVGSGPGAAAYGFSAAGSFLSSLFRSPSPIIQNGSLGTAGAATAAGITTGPTYAQAGISPDLPLTPSSPSLLTSLYGDPAVTSVSDQSSMIDYPGLQTYMSDPTAPDPNAVSYA